MNANSSQAAVAELRGVLLRWALLIAAIGVFSAWATCRMTTAAGRLPAATNSTTATTGKVSPEIEYWTCTIHSEVRQSQEGDCPACGMALVAKYAGVDQPGIKPDSTASGSEPPGWYRCTMPECGDQGSQVSESRCPVCGMKRERVDNGDTEAGEFEIKLSDRAQRLAEITVENAQRRLLHKRIRTVGRVSFDETRYKMVSAWMSGRIDKLFADFTGMTVSRGDHLVEIYSPEILTAQEEFLQAVRSTTSSTAMLTDVARRSSEQVLSAARRKLELLGVTTAQIAAIARSGEPQTHLVVHAPIGGTILAKKAMEGMYVKTGDPLYTIADLHYLWVLIELYESDLPWVKPFQHVTVTTRSLPGEVFTGQIVFVDPKVNPQTRTVPVRIHVDNPAMRLKPDMWVTAQIDSGLGRGGRGAIPAPGGAFACPMHPWEASDELTQCPVCEMDMKPVDHLADFATPTHPVPLLSVPRGAVMQTGARAVVYAASEPGVFRGVEVIVGPLARGEDGREYYTILSGLNENDRIVTRGSFAIDSQMQLAGKPSLFVARGLTGHDHKHPLPSGSARKNVSSSGQTQCPVMGGVIDPEVFIEYEGVTVHFCCWGCDDRFLAEPDKYIPNLPQELQRRIRAAGSRVTTDANVEEEQELCPVMGGEINPEVFLDFHGIRLFFCCPPCIEKFVAEPGKYVARLPKHLQIRIKAAESKESGND